MPRTIANAPNARHPKTRHSQADRKGREADQAPDENVYSKRQQLRRRDELPEPYGEEESE